jgi:molybdopterin-guanine dinucleotide biosynthesis protein A
MSPDEAAMRIGGIILCGGRSSRMGQPKAWLPFGDEVMLQRIVRIVRAVVDPVVVVAAPGQDVPELPDVQVIRDQGPLMPRSCPRVMCPA